eukprot:5546102-Pyramimonas_sp.AAC.1
MRLHGTNGDSHHEWRSFKTLLRYGGRAGRPAPTIRLKDHNGAAVLTDEEEDQAVLEFFAQAEDADIISKSELVNYYNGPLHHDPFPVVSSVEPALLPSLHSVTDMFTKVKRRKAAGRDMIQGELVAGCPAEMARHYAPLMLKVCLLQQEPLSWKHGIVHPLFKGKGAIEDLKNYRSILLNGVISKCWHRFLRHQLSEYLELMLRPTQCGGRAGHSTTQLIHLLTSYMQVSRKRGRNTIITFVDLSSAFYSTVRSLVLPAEGNSEDEEYIMNNHEMPLAMLPLYTFALSQPSALHELRHRPHLLALLIEAHRCTHFSTRRDGLQARSRRGSRPGTSLADAVFNLSFEKPLSVAAENIAKLNVALPLLLDTEPQILSTRDTHNELYDGSFVDDGVFLAAPEIAEDTIETAGAL